MSYFWQASFHVQTLLIAVFAVKTDVSKYPSMSFFTYFERFPCAASFAKRRL